MNYPTAGIELIAEHFCNSGVKTAVLLGAGASVSAGIPAAPGIIAHIKSRPQLCRQAGKETYPEYMNLLAPGERKALIKGYISRSKVNLAHLYLAMLVKKGYVDRILTTNFDPLVIQSLALFNLFPAVYDFAGSSSYIPGEEADLSVYYLHGQAEGFVLLNTKEEVQKLAGRLDQLFIRVGERRSWLVIGYSGDNDPVFKKLSELEEFRYKLFWVGYEQNPPAQHILDEILKPEKYGFFVPGYNADSFFLKLNRELGLPAPPIWLTPFSHLKETLQLIKEDITIDEQELKPARQARKWVEEAIKGFEKGKGFAVFTKQEIKLEELQKEAMQIRLENRFEQIEPLLAKLKTLPKAKTRKIREINKNLSSALSNWGITLKELALIKSGEERENLLRQAEQKYQAALKLKPDYYAVLTNWGITLKELALIKSGEQRENLLRQSDQKYQEALKIKPDFYYALNNWGDTLQELAKIKSGEERKSLLKQSEQKYQEALKLKPDDYYALNNWGNTLIRLSYHQPEQEKAVTLEKAKEVLQKAEALEPGSGAYNLACVYSLQKEKEKALEWLEKYFQYKTSPSLEHILKDSDLDYLKSDPRFKALLKKYFPEA